MIKFFENFDTLKKINHNYEMVSILWFTFQITFVSCHSNRTSKDTLGMSNYVSCPLSMLTYQKTFEVRLYILTMEVIIMPSAENHEKQLLNNYLNPFNVKM